MAIPQLHVPGDWDLPLVSQLKWHYTLSLATVLILNSSTPKDELGLSASDLEHHPPQMIHRRETRGMGTSMVQPQPNQELPATWHQQVPLLATVLTVGSKSSGG